MFWFSHILAYGLYHIEKRASDYTQHSLVDALLEHVAKFILDAFSLSALKQHLLTSFLSKRLCSPGAKQDRSLCFAHKELVL